MSTIWDNLDKIFQVIIAVGALAAYAIYFIQKKVELRTAASLILEQIDQIEQTIALMKKPEYSGNAGIYKLPILVTDNYWNKYKILFVRKMRPSQVKLLDDYYNNVLEIQKGTNAIREAMLNAWKYRSFAHQFGLGNIVSEYSKLYANCDNEAELNHQYLCRLDKFNGQMNSLDNLFTAGLPQQVYRVNLSSFLSVRGCDVYSFLEKMSYRTKHLF